MYCIIFASSAWSRHIVDNIKEWWLILHVKYAGTRSITDIKIKLYNVHMLYRHNILILTTLKCSFKNQKETNVIMNCSDKNV